MGRHLALERAALLAKLLVNLHFFVEGSCAPELKVRDRGQVWLRAERGWSLLGVLNLWEAGLHWLWGGCHSAQVPLRCRAGSPTCC